MVQSEINKSRLLYPKFGRLASVLKEIFPSRKQSFRIDHARVPEFFTFTQSHVIELRF